MDQGQSAQKYAPSWDSLEQYRTPQWFKDAKLGIFIHWGVYSVPAFHNEWYPRHMYQKGTPAFEHHHEVWGSPGRFGYKDFIPMFQAENWDPEAWVDLFQEAGARYIVPVAEHHDGFAMYHTDFTRWNAAAMGPKRDIIGDLMHSVRARDLKFGVSSHRAFNWRYYTFEEGFDTMAPGLSDLYTLPHEPGEPASPHFLADWLGRTKELIDRFQPDVLWFDFGWHHDEFAPYRPQVAAYYYNRAEEWGSEVVLNYKDKFPPGVAVYDIERGKLPDIRTEYWQTDTSVSYKSWSYIEDDKFKSVTTVVHDLVDIVSKNGNLLLNVGPKPDGSIPPEAESILRGLGAWLQVNGEAIYETRCWHIYGEGETAVAGGHMSERENKPFSARDIRFTIKENALYAICMGWPGEKLTIRSLGTYSRLPGAKIDSIRLLGFDDQLAWSQDLNGLTISLPSQPAGEHAFSFKIQVKDD